MPYSLRKKIVAGSAIALLAVLTPAAFALAGNLTLQGNNSYGTEISSSSPAAQLSLTGPGQAAVNSYGLYITPKTAGTNNFNLYSGTALEDLTAAEESYLYTQSNAFIQNAANFYGSFLALNFARNASDYAAIGSYTIGLSEIGSGNLFLLEGTENLAAHVGAGTVTTAYATENTLTADTGTITTGAILHAGSGGVSNGGAITALYGLKVEDQTAGGTNYSIHTNQTSGTNNYAYYGAGAAKSYFGGNIGIGTTTPSQALDVIGNIKLSGSVLSDGDICIGACQ